jgi:hypothetical protein
MCLGKARALERGISTRLGEALADSVVLYNPAPLGGLVVWDAIEGQEETERGFSGAVFGHPKVASMGFNDPTTEV